MSSLVARDEMEPDEVAFNKFGSFRRSLRQINPFKSRLFRLPATPRLARARKGLSRAEEPTSWNFERPLYGSQMTSSAVTNADSTSSSSVYGDLMCRTVPSDNPAILRQLPPREGPAVGGSCRMRPNRHSRPPLPSYHPPNAQEAEEVIHEHMKNLMVTNGKTQNQFLFLPDTLYAPTGEVCEASWRSRGDTRSHVGVEPPSSPTHSTISCLQTGRTAMRSLSYGTKDDKPQYHRPQYVLNGLVHQPSMKSLVEQHVPNGDLKDTSIQSELLHLTPENGADSVFLGREWLFKELYQTSIAEHTQITLIKGAHGTGKSAIMKQLVLHSPFYVAKNSSGDTVDSGIVANSQSSTEHSLSSKNYEWLHNVANNVVAYHECRLYSAITCGIPELIKKLVSHFRASQVLRGFNEIINESKELDLLCRDDSAVLHISPIQLFRRLIVEPLMELDKQKSHPESIIIVVDAIDEGEFHRNENGESVAWLIKQCFKELPSWVRWILSSSTDNTPFTGAEARSLYIDDIELDERVARDMRLIADYRITVNPQLSSKIRDRRNLNSQMAVTEFVDEIVHRAQGNALFITLLIDMIEQDYIQVKNMALSLLPNDLSQLYLLYFNCVFNSLQQFHAASTVMSVILASLKPLTFERLLQIMNSGNINYRISSKELETRLYSLRHFIIKLNLGVYVQAHNSLREWLLHGSNHTDYLINVRYGHLLHALYYTRKGDSNPEALFELGHHLLKANPHKYMPPDLAPEMPIGRDAQILWIQRTAGTRIQGTLLYDRNIYYPNNKVSRLLLMAGAQVNIFWMDMQEPLFCTYSRSNNITLIKLLIQMGVDVNCCSRSNGMSPLMHSVKENHVEVAECLLENGADLSMRDSIGDTVLVHAAKARSTQLFAMLNDHEWNDLGGTYEVKAEQIRKSFEVAVENGDLELCEYILNRTDVTLDLASNMLIACSNAKLDLVQFFLTKGVTLASNHRWKDKSALICAVESGSWDLVVNVLSGYEGDINEDIIPENGWNSLIVASRLGHLGLIELLLNKGVNINYVDKENMSALFHAVVNEHFSLASQLVNHGADIHLVDSEGNTLLHLLAIHHNKSLVDRLLESGISVDNKNNQGMRAVEIALTNGKHNAVDVFLRRGARLRSLTWKIAAESNPQHLISLIRKLFEDGRTLYKRNRFDEAMHRFHHAMEKCTEFLIEENAITSMIASTAATSNNTQLNVIQPQLRLCKCELLYTVADIKRQNGEFTEACQIASEALKYADADNVIFQLHYFRAKCYFDDQKMSEAREEAQLAAALRPDNGDIQVLLAALSTPNLNVK